MKKNNTGKTSSSLVSFQINRNYIGIIGKMVEGLLFDCYRRVKPVLVDTASKYPWLILAFVAVAHEFPWTRYKVVGTFSLILGILSMLFTLAHVRTNNCPSGVVTLITWTSTGACKI